MGHLRQQITPLDSGVEMLQTLEGMFTKSTASERQAAITDLINTRMTGGRVCRPQKAVFFLLLLFYYYYYYF